MYKSFKTAVSAMLSCIALAFVLADGASAQTPSAQTPEQPWRELFVPFEELDVLLANDARRVYMTRTEYEDLLSRAKVKIGQVPPEKIAMISANYRAEVAEGRVAIQGEIQLEVLESGVQVLPLKMSGVGVRGAKLDDGPAALAKNDQGQIWLFVEGQGKHRLTLDMIMPIATEAAQQTLQFQLPPAPTSELELTVPGNVEIKSGAAIINREVDESADKTVFKILPSRDPIALVMSLNNRTQRAESTIVARSVLIAEVTQAYERLHATVSMSVLNGASDEFRYEIDDDLEVNSVTSELLSRWSIERVDGKQQLVVLLRTPALSREVVNIRLDRITRNLDAWRMPTFMPMNVAGNSSIVGLLAEDRLNVTSIEPESLIAVDSNLLTSALPTSLTTTDLGAPKLEAVAAYYAPQSPYGLAAQFVTKSARVVVDTFTYVTVSNSGLTAESRFTLLPQNEQLFFFEFECPAEWTIDSVKSAERQNLKFDRFAMPADTNRGALARIRVSLPSGIAAGGQQSVLIKGQFTPADWFTPWQASVQSLPNFRVLNTENQAGVIAVRLEDDLQVTPESTQGLMVMNSVEKKRYDLSESVAGAAYRFDTADWSSTQKIMRIPSRIVALVHSFVQLNTESLNSHSEIVFQVKQASVQSVAFTLPESTPSEVEISGLGDTVVKESSSVIAAGRRVWTVQLAERKSGAARIAVDFTQTLNTENALTVTLPIARAQDVAYQSGTIAVEGHSELEIAMTQSPRPVDIGELVDANYQVGKRLVGVFGYVGLADAAIANVSRRPVHRLPTTIVERAELVTLVSVHGFSQTAARFKLRSKAAYIESELPFDAKLWSVVLDGKSALPQREGNRVLITIPPNKALAVRDLQLVYESPTEQVQLRGEIGVLAPKLFEREDVNTETVSVPIADAKWELILPNGYQVALTGGTLRADNASGGTSSLEWLMHKFWTIGGGGHIALASAMQERRFDPAAGLQVEGELKFNYKGTETLRSRAPSASTSGPLADSAGDRLFAEETSPLPLNAFGLPEMLEKQSVPAQPEMSAVDGFAASDAKKDSREFASPQTLNEVDQVAQSGASLSQNPPSRAADSINKQLWAMEGVRSLAIEFDQRKAGDMYSLSSLGLDPQVQVTIVHKPRLDWLAVAVGMVVFVVGLLIVPKRRAARLGYFFAVGIAAFLAQPVTGWYVELEQSTTAVMVSLVLLAAVMLLSEISQRLGRRLACITADRAIADYKELAPHSVTAILLALVFACNSASVSCAQSEPPPGTVVTGAEQLMRLIQSMEVGGKVSLPADAVVIPFDASAPGNFEKAEKLLVPYDEYERLWNLAHPEKKLPTADLPARFAWSAATYAVRLDSSDSLRMTGSVTVDQFTDDEVAIPLQLAGCVIEEAKLDGRPPRLQMLAVESQGADQQVSKGVAEPSLPAAMYVLYSKGKGRKQLELKLRWQLEQRSGWRALEGALPLTPAAELTITVSKPNTEVRLTGGVDRANFETTEANGKIITALSADGRLSLQWRDKTSEAKVDQGLSVQTRSVFDIQEDALKLAWHGEFEFRRGRRESFAVQVPPGYIVEKVVGTNIRGWTVKGLEGVQQLDIELLKGVADRETLSIFISKQTTIDAQSTARVSAPQIVVPDAMLQQGHIAVRRSAMLDVRAESSKGLTRVEAIDESSWLAEHEVASILPIKVYQAYRYSQVPYELSLSVNPVPSTVRVQSQSLLRISQLERTLETRLLVTSEGRPIYRLQVVLPSEWKFQTPIVPGRFQWSLSPSGNQQLLQIYLADGQSNEFPVILRGLVRGESLPNEPLDLPRIEVVDAERQTGSIVVQSDPAYDVRVANLQGCESALLESVKEWLRVEQRESARAVIRFQEPRYSGQLLVTPRAPVVKSFSVTNVKVTDRAIEETLFIEADIRSAGIREFSFRMPSGLASAKIRAPHVRQIDVQPLADDAASVQVRLQLQDAIMGQFRVVIEHDREVSSGPHTVPMPVIETGTTDHRLVTLENSGRDELVVSKVERFEQIDRAQLNQRFPENLLGGQSSQAYLANEGAGDAQLAYVTKSRELISTVGARIGLAQTLLVVDEVGTYRATQEYRVENRTEPFLELELPMGSQLWTAQVAGEAVKPAIASGKSNAGASPSGSSSTDASLAASSSAKQRVRIPLIKTAEGDLDYAVVIKYGGRMETPGWLNRVEFPLIHTSNINVELSQVRLRLPESVGWFNFGGTLGRVQSEGDLQAGWLSYRTRQLTELSQMLGSKAPVSDYTRFRALNNLSTLGSSIAESNRFLSKSAESNKNLAEQLSSNSAALETAKQQAAQVANSQDLDLRSNRVLLNNLYGQQTNSRSFNALNDLAQNFNVPLPNESSAWDVKELNSQQQFWFEQNRLHNKPGEEQSRLSGEEKSARAQLDLSLPSGRIDDSLKATIPSMRDERAESQWDDGEATQAQRYGRRLQRNDNSFAYNPTDEQPEVPSKSKMGDQSADFGSVQPPVSGMGGGFGGVGGAPAEGGEVQLGQNARAGGAQVQNAASTEGGFMASLDVELPVRGREYFFSTPRGELQLSAQGMATRTAQRLYAIAVVIVTAICLWAVYLMAVRITCSGWGMIAFALLLALIGGVSLAQQYLPIYGGLALLGALYLLVAKWESSSPLPL